MKPDRRFILTGLGVLPLAACGSLVPLPGQGPRPEDFDLRGAVPKSMPSGPKLNLQLAVVEPNATNGLDTDRIAVRPSPLRIDYYANARWTDRAPALLQSLLQQSLNATDRISAARLGALVADVNLSSELNAFDAVVDGDGPPHIEIEWRLRLVRPGQGRVIASKLISESEPAAATDIASVVRAFEIALRRSLSAAVAFVLEDLQSFKP